MEEDESDLDDEDDRRALLEASRKGNIDVVRDLIEQKHVGCNLTDRIGTTPLHKACEWGHLEIVQCLVERGGADIHTRSRGMLETPLHMACFRGHLHVVKYLIEICHADVHIRASDGATPLHRACLLYDNVTEYLLEKTDADINSAEFQGQTPLHHACYNINLHMVQYLVGHGANVTAKNKYKDTPLTIALGRGRNTFTYAATTLLMRKHTTIVDISLPNDDDDDDDDDD